MYNDVHHCRSVVYTSCHWESGIGLCEYYCCLTVHIYQISAMFFHVFFTSTRYHTYLIVLSLVLMSHYCVYIGKVLQKRSVF